MVLPLHECCARGKDDCALYQGLVSDAGDRLAAFPRFSRRGSISSFYLAAQKNCVPINRG